MVSWLVNGLVPYRSLKPSSSRFSEWCFCQAWWKVNFNELIYIGKVAVFEGCKSCYVFFFLGGGEACFIWHEGVCVILPFVEKIVGGPLWTYVYVSKFISCIHVGCLCMQIVCLSNVFHHGWVFGSPYVEQRPVGFLWKTPGLPGYIADIPWRLLLGCPVGFARTNG